MMILNPITFSEIKIDEEKTTPEIVELLEEYNNNAMMVRELLINRDIAMLNIMAKTNMAFNDFLYKIKADD